MAIVCPVEQLEIGLAELLKQVLIKLYIGFHSFVPSIILLYKLICYQLKVTMYYQIFYTEEFYFLQSYHQGLILGFIIRGFKS